MSFTPRPEHAHLVAPVQSSPLSPYQEGYLAGRVRRVVDAVEYGQYLDAAPEIEPGHHGIDGEFTLGWVDGWQHYLRRPEQAILEARGKCPVCGCDPRILCDRCRLSRCRYCQGRR